MGLDVSLCIDTYICRYEIFLTSVKCDILFHIPQPVVLKCKYTKLSEIRMRFKVRVRKSQQGPVSPIQTPFVQKPLQQELRISCLL